MRTLLYEAEIKICSYYRGKKKIFKKKLVAPQPRQKLRKTASTASKMASTASLMIPLNSWQNSDLFKKKSFSVALKTPELASYTPSPRGPLKKSILFFWPKEANSGVFRATEEPFF